MVKDKNEARFYDPSQVVITKKEVSRYKKRRQNRLDTRGLEGKDRFEGQGKEVGGK